MFNNQVILPKWLYKTPCVWWRKAVESLWYEYNEHLHSDSNCSSHLDSRICKNMYFKYAELIIKGSSMHTRSEMQFSNRIRGHFVGPTSIVFLPWSWTIIHFPHIIHLHSTRSLKQGFLTLLCTDRENLNQQQLLQCNQMMKAMK